MFTIISSAPETGSYIRREKPSGRIRHLVQITCQALAPVILHVTYILRETM